MYGFVRVGDRKKYRVCTAKSFGAKVGMAFSSLPCSLSLSLSLSVPR